MIYQQLQCMDFISIAIFIRNLYRDFPGGPVVKNLPSNAGNTSSIPGRGTKIPHAMGQLSLRAAARETCVLQLTREKAPTLQ